jgi:hypothetical protein
MNEQALNRIFQEKFGITLTGAELAELSSGTDAAGRSPFRPRQLTDLRLLPRADDPRPTFYSTAEVPRDWDTTAQHEYPKLMWSPAGVEVRIDAGKDAKAQEMTLEKRGYLHTPPMDQSPVDAVEREMAQLSDEDRAFVLEAQSKARMARLQERIAGLSEADLAQIVGAKAKKAKSA